MQLTDSRRYDIDWLRTLAFILLIFYHIAMFYVVGWDWHVKSAYQSEFLKNFMLVVNQWRMPLIFLVSGIALSLVEHKIGIWALFRMRFVRIYIPLVIGMYLIVPPQLFYQLIQSEGFNGSYVEFISFYVDIDTNMYPEHQHAPIGLITWNHLWYLPYLFSYTLVYMLIKPLLSRINWPLLLKHSPAFLVFFIPVALLIFYSMWLQADYPTTHALIDDWYNHAVSFTFFMLGFILAKTPEIWGEIIKHHKLWLGLALMSYIIVMIRYHRLLGFDIDYEESSMLTQTFIQFIWRANTVLWLLAVIGFSGAYLNKKNRILSYMNEAVLPWYILHQTVIVVVGMWLAKYSLGGFVEPVMLILLTFTVCFVGYELIKRNNITRFMFGMKMKDASATITTAKLPSATEAA